jgi:hypothetical protein
MHDRIKRDIEPFLDDHEKDLTQYLSKKRKRDEVFPEEE